MSTTRAIAKNTVIQFASRALATILGVAVIGVMTRELGLDGFGAYTTASAFIQIFGVLTDFGISIVALQMLSEADANQAKILGNALTLRFATAAVFLGMAPLVALAFPYPLIIKLGILLFVPSQFANAGVQVLTTVFQRRLRMERAAAGELTSRVIQILGVVAAAFYDWGLLGIIAAIAAGNLIQFILAFVLAEKTEPFKLEVDRRMWREIMRRSAPIGLSIAFNVIYLRADALILSLTRTQAEVGLYGAAYRVIDVLTVLPFLFMGLIMPLMSNSWSIGDRNRLARITQRAFDAMAIAAIPLAAGAAILGRPLMRLVAGDAFEVSGGILAILTVGLASIFIGAVAGHGIVALGLQGKMVRFYAADAAVSLALYFLAIPRFGVWGAAGVTVFSELFIAIAASALYLRRSGIHLRLSVAAKSILASAAMAGLLFILRDLPILAGIAIGGVIYLTFLFILGGIPKEILAQLRRQPSDV